MRTPYYGNSQKNQAFGVGSTMKYYDPWNLKKEDLPDVDDFDQTKDYTPWELDRYADAFLWKVHETNPCWNDPVVLMHEHLHERRKREIYSVEGKPDARVTKDLSPDGETMYWRSYPKGRKLNKIRRRKKDGQRFKNDHGASYYR